ncbi:anhydro-N-acetylmuramic acid kinase [Rubidibacter lacunae]|uniref:anhydro-N-acetylmuramic acid kinase n=1 Tax=Rubidibacter lacunae TaxID=582514 RepID=UPI000687EADC|nr:anhydro-N-acetylmuramic acid kinase [Rubidibacter lacunae]
MPVIGLVSGTSADGIDAALVNVDGTDTDLRVELLAGATYPYPPDLRATILAVCAGQPLSLEELVALDDAIAWEFAAAARAIQSGQPAARAIGSHGQTVFHRPPAPTAPVPLGRSFQLGRGEAIAHLTDLPTASNFRAADIAVGGEGAPLVSKLDACLLAHPTEARCIQNLGGIGNVTYLPPKSSPDWERSICGWDTGPGNALLDLAVTALTNGEQTYDDGGAWAARGTCDRALVDTWLEHCFFHQPPPKSTGRELFGAGFLTANRHHAERLDPADWLATLTELTAATVAHSYRSFLPALPNTVLLCGGGRHNQTLVGRLQALLPETTITTTDAAGLDGDRKEAIAFAVLGYWRARGDVSGNLPGVTGARAPVLLGDLHLPGKFPTNGGRPLPMRQVY